MILDEGIPGIDRGKLELREFHELDSMRTSNRHTGKCLPLVSQEH